MLPNRRYFPANRFLSVFATTIFLIFLGCRPQATDSASENKAPAAAPPVTPVAATTTVASGTTSSLTTHLKSLSWQEAFETVATTIAYEPYNGVLRGVEGTARARKGNSLDQAVLLASSIHDNVAGYRFANGILSPEQTVELLATISPENIAIKNEDVDIERYALANDTELINTAANHFWLEIKEHADSEWLALDPTLANNAPGQALADVTRHYGSPSRSLFQQLQFEVKMQTGSGVKNLGSMHGAVSEMAFMPLEIVLHGLPLYEEVIEEPGEEVDKPAVGSPFGGLMGGAPPKKNTTTPKSDKPKTTGPAIGTTISVDVIFNGKTSSAPDYSMLIADPQTFVERIWIEFNLSVPGEDDRIFERALYESTESTAVRGPIGIHRYDVSVVNSQVTRPVFDEIRRYTIEEIDVEALAALRESLASGQANEADLSAASNAERTTGSALSRLVSLAFAHESDSMSTAIARRGGVTMTHHVPRILITSIETRPDNDATTSEINLDLRLDEVKAIPFDGMPLGTQNLFQRARGMQESSLEGEVLQNILDSGTEVITTVDVMRISQDAGIPLTVLTPEDVAMISQIDGLSRWDALRMRRTLEGGDNIIVPAQKVQVNGEPKIGWWRIEKRTGAFVGVMEGGEHQAMTQYTTTSVNEMLSPSQGFLLGMLNGAVGTHVLLAAGMLKYGQYSQRLKEEVKAQLQYLNCVMCPEAKIEVSLGSTGGASAQIASCYEFEILENHELSYGKSASLPFCDWYKKGVSCASSLILDGLTVSIETEEAEGPSVDWTIPYDC